MDNNLITKHKKSKNQANRQLRLFFLCISLIISSSQLGFSQSEKISLNYRDTPIKTVFEYIEATTEYKFVYKTSEINTNQRISINETNRILSEVLTKILQPLNIKYRLSNKHIALFNPETVSIKGVVVDASGETVIGANVMEKGSKTNGTVTDIDGKFSISLPKGHMIQISYVGYTTQEVLIKDKKDIKITIKEDLQSLEEVVVIGYGSIKKSDLTGSVVRADLNSFKESGNTSILQSLQGSISGMEVSQTTKAGEDASMDIRGKSSINGASQPLIVLDGTIYRGKMIDINPNDVESINVLKDASSAAIYGSQAANGVVIITTKKGSGVEGKPTVSYSGYYSFQSPTKELKPGTPEDFAKKNEWSDIYNSRTEESDYLEKNPNWNITDRMKTTNEINAYNEGRTTDWYDLLTNDNMNTQSHNLSLSNRTQYSNYLVSVGYTGQDGYMENDNYERFNARINIDNQIKDWLMIGVQSFMTASDYSGITPSAISRYYSPYAASHDEEGELVPIPTGLGINPLIAMDADHLDKRLKFFGNIYADINIPFINGLKYKVNFSNTYNTTSNYSYKYYETDFQGEGSKAETKLYDYSLDNILTYQRRFKEIHNLNAMVGYGVENRTQNSTTAKSSIFASDKLGYNNLQVGSAEMQRASSGAWEESSLYSMARLIYGYNSRYLFTGTIRRDGFSGFSKKNKFGTFPSASLAWVASEENFMNEIDWLNNLKIRVSYGSVGNRTVGRYQTSATVNGGYNYITADGSPIYTQFINSLESSDLKWETTTGINLGLDFSVISQRLWGTIDYYNNNTTDLLYNVDIPGMSGYASFPDNLGKIHNQGLEITLNSVNIRKNNFEWGSSFIFSRNRNELKELLGFDNDGDGKEDDLISEGLFIGESLGAIYDYTIDGLWQVGDDIPDGYNIGAFKVVDLNRDGKIDVNDKSIIGYKDPAYTISMSNYFTYKNWSLRLFITSAQGGENHFMKTDNILSFGIKNQENHFNVTLPEDLDYWKPETPNARYQRPNIQVSDGIQGVRYAQRNYIRLQDISIAYTFSQNFNKKCGLQNLKVYASGKNLLTLTGWNGWDPETGVGITNSGLPVTKSFTVGLNIEF